MIRKKRVDWHKRLNISAFLLSCLFLVSYIVFHAFGVETRFPADNPLRPFYLFVLLTHIVLAAVVLPLVLLSFYRGLTGQIEAHKKLTRWSMPIWLYVTISGVVVYLLISPHYTF
jgi:putative membrane protein